MLSANKWSKLVNFHIDSGILLDIANCASFFGSGVGRGVLMVPSTSSSKKIPTVFCSFVVSILALDLDLDKE